MSFSLTLSMPVVREAKGTEFRRPEDAARELADLRNAAKECFVVITLDTKYRLIDRHLVSMGILDACLVHPREVFRPAILDQASAIVVSHNHPSGDPTPSAADLKITRQLIQAGRAIEIEVLDHVIIGRPDQHNADGFISVRESGMVDFATS
jgi:DNA repair protein RadC